MINLKVRSHRTLYGNWETIFSHDQSEIIIVNESKNKVYDKSEEWLMTEMNLIQAYGSSSAEKRIEIIRNNYPDFFRNH